MDGAQTRQIFKLAATRCAVALALYAFSTDRAEAQAQLTPPAPVTPQAVSFLFGLEALQEHAIAPLERARFGVVLPSERLRAVGRLVGDRELSESTRLSVVSVRVDPCFLETAGEIVRPALSRGASRPDCVPQIRAVLQPIDWGLGESRPSVLDAALHVFYRLSVAEWEMAACELLALRRGAQDVVVDARDEAMRLREWLLRWIGSDRLTRVTAMRLVAGGNEWEFLGWDRTRDGWRPMPLLGVSRGYVARLSIAPSLALEFEGGSNGVTAELVLLDRLLRNSASMHGVARSWRSRLRQDLARVEHPDRRGVGQVDCVSCHVARSATAWLERETRAQGESPLPVEDRLASDPGEFGGVDGEHAWAVLTRRGRANTRNLRAFGYFGRLAVASPRTLNESIRIARELSEPNWLRCHSSKDDDPAR